MPSGTLLQRRTEAQRTRLCTAVNGAAFTTTAENRSQLAGLQQPTKLDPALPERATMLLSGAGHSGTQ